MLFVAEFSFNIDTSAVKHTYFLWLLDAHNVDRAMGVPADIFRAIFYICAQCGRYMTQRVSFNHHDWDDWDSEDFDEKHPQCIYLRTVTESERGRGAVLATSAFLSGGNSGLPKY